MIVCTGSIAFDYLMSFPGHFKEHILADKLDRISLSFLVDTMVKQRGGTAPNIAFTLAMLGTHPWVVGTVGEDFEDYRKWLEDAGVNTKYVRVIPGKYTASFFANTDLSNAQIASFYTGAMANASEISLWEFEKNQPDMVIISPNDPKAMRQYSEECQQMKIPYMYDPSQQLVRIDPEDIRVGVMGCESLFVNDYEYELLQNRTKLKHDEIIAKVKFVVVTYGEKGARVYADCKETKIPIVPAKEIVDPTGVGDAFRGGFVRGYLLGLDWQTCGQMGALAATYCLEQRGPQNHKYSIQEFIDRYRQNFNDKGALDALL